MTENRSLLRGGGALVAVQVISVAAQVVSSGFTARILSVAAFGTFALAMSITGLFALAVTAGVGSSILKEAVIDESYIWAVRTVATLSAFAAGALAVVVSGSTWLALGTDELAVFLIILCPLPGLMGLCAVESALLRREGRLGRDAICQLTGTVLGVSLSVLIAIGTRAPTALLVSPLTTNGVALALLAASRQVRYRRTKPRREDVRSVALFARRVMLQNVGFLVVGQLPLWAVSACLSSTAAGFYSRASLLSGMPANALSGAAVKAIQPSYRHLTEESRRDGISDAVLFVAGLVLPMYGGVAVLARPIVDLWLGPGWEPVGQIAVPLCAAFGLSVVFTVAANAAETHGDFRSVRRAQVIMSVGVLLPLLILPFSPSPVVPACGVVAAYACGGCVLLYSMSESRLTSLPRLVAAVRHLFTQVALVVVSGTAVRYGLERLAGSDRSIGVMFAEVVCVGGVMLIVWILALWRAPLLSVLLARNLLPRRLRQVARWAS